MAEDKIKMIEAKIITRVNITITKVSTILMRGRKEVKIMTFKAKEE